MRIAVAGAGGMGGRFALYLHQAGNEVFLIDQWQANIDAIRADGLQAELNGAHVSARIPVYAPQELKDRSLQADLVIALTKAPQLDAMFQALSPVLHQDTMVLCLLNGLGHEEVLSRYVPMERILLGVTMWTAGMSGPGKLKLGGNGKVEIQNLRPEGADAAHEIVRVFSEAGLNAVYSGNVRWSIWRKACVNGTLNPLCSLLECNIHDLSTTPGIQDTMMDIIHEFAAAAETEDVHLDPQEVYAHIASAFPIETIGLHYPSMYQDLVLNHRLTEIDYINGAAARKAEAAGLSAPCCRLLTQLIHQKEALLGAH